MTVLFLLSQETIDLVVGAGSAVPLHPHDNSTMDIAHRLRIVPFNCIESFGSDASSLV